MFQDRAAHIGGVDDALQRTSDYLQEMKEDLDEFLKSPEMKDYQDKLQGFLEELKIMDQKEMEKWLEKNSEAFRKFLDDLAGRSSMAYGSMIRDSAS